MQTFQDSVTSQVWSFNPDVVATNTDGVYSFKTAGGVALNVPTTLQPYTVPPPPGPTLAQQAATLLATKTAAGLALTSTGTPALNAAYALDSVSTAQIFQIGLYAAQFEMFPSGGATQAYPDASSALHVFTVPQFVAFLHAVASLISGLTTQAGIMAEGGNPVWPSQSAVIA
jgi:hypothetical protein